MRPNNSLAVHFEKNSRALFCNFGSTNIVTSLASTVGMILHLIDVRQTQHLDIRFSHQTPTVGLSDERDSI